MTGRLTFKLALEADGFAKGVERALEGIDALAATEVVVDLVFEALTDNEKSAVLILYACEQLPAEDLSGRFRELGLLAGDSTLSGLGRRVAERILEDEPCR